MNKDSQVFKTIRRSNMTTIIFSVIGLIIMGVLGVLFSVPYYLAEFTGPIEISSKEISELDGSEHLYNQAVSGLDMDDTYYYEETVNEDTGRQVSIDAYFGALEVEKDVWILVRSPEEINTRQEDYVGNLHGITDSIARDVAERAADEMNIEFLPIMLDTTDDEVMWYAIGTGVLAIIGLASIWGVFAFIQRSSNPVNHPIVKKLGRFGDAEDIIHLIDKDLTMGDDKVGKLRFTRSYLINNNGNTFDAMPYSAVAWAHKMIKSGKYGKTYEAHIYDVTGHQMSIIAKETEVDAMLEAIRGRAPWAIVGYSDDIKRMWNKERQTLLAEIENRRMQYASH